MHTECKLIILDPERASSLETTVSNISEATGGTKFLVMDTTDRTRRWQGMEFFNDAVDLFPDVKDGYTKAPTQGMDPEDDATIIFTSGICLSASPTRDWLTDQQARLVYRKAF